MAIDPLDPDLLPLPEAAKLAGVSYDALWTWARAGTRGVVLETVNKGRLIYTSREALREFFARLTPTAPPQRESPGAFQRRAKRVQEQLDRKLRGKSC